jgi:hypothetical protein
VTTLVSIAGRDHLGVDASTALGRFALALNEAGLSVAEWRDATDTDVQALGSSWAKRLGIPRRRAASLLVAQKGRVRRG